MMPNFNHPRRWLADAYFGPGPVAAAVLIAVAAVAWAWRSMGGHLAFPDVVAGYVALNDADKGIDFRACGLFGAVVAGAAVGIGRTFRRVAPDGPSSDTGGALTQALLLSLAPAVWRLTITFTHPQPDRLPMFRLLVLFPLGVWAVAVALARYPRGSVRRSDVVACVGGAVLSVVFAVFATIGAAVAPQRLGVNAAAAKWIARVAPDVIPAVGGFAAAAVFVIWLISPDVGRFRRRVLRGLVLWQLPVPLLIFMMVPTPLFDAGGLIHVRYPALLVGTLGVLAAAGMGFISWRFGWRRRPPAGTLRRAVAPAAVVALAVYCHVGVPTLPFPERDYFHVGEQVLPWQQVWDFHTVPYADFVPVHGLMAYMRGGLNQLFFDGTIAHYSPCEILLTGLAAAAIAGGACVLVGPVGALVLAPVSLPGLDRLYFLPAGLFLVAAPALWRRPTRGLVLWAGVCLLEVAYNFVVGPAFVVATVPVAVWAATRAGWGRTLAVAGGVVVVAAAAAAVPDVRLTAVGFVHFVLDNGGTNNLAHGLPWAAGAWARDIEVGFGSNQASWETFRLSWMLVAVVAVGLVWRAAAVRGSTGSPGRRGLVPLAVAVAGVLVITVPWTMGRIGGGVFSRPGEMSGLAVCTILPVLLLMAVPARRAAGAVLVAAIVGAYIQYGDATDVDPNQLLGKMAARRVIPAEFHLLDGATVGLPGLGKVYVPKDNGWVADLIALRQGLDRLLRKDETFEDLTEQQAIHYYLGMRVPVRYVAYVAANSKLQAGEERQLAARPAAAVMIGPSAWFDDMPPSMRCYRLWRDAALTDVPVSVGPFTFLVDSTRAAAYDHTPPRPEAGGRPVDTETELEILDTYMRPTDLQRLPVAWGRSWPTLRSEFDVVGDGTVAPPTAADRWATATVPTATVPDGAAADFVLLRVSLTPSHPALYRRAVDDKPAPPDTPTAAEPEMALQWADRSGAWPAAAAHFKAHDGTLLVPLGVFPRWLLGRGCPAIRACVLNEASVASWHLDAVTFLRLKPM